ncbi:toll/interleukin-1 receptor domain-containing protein [Frankia sp. R82]|nr:toll/interleukin-1 receptor domain-containing protein [Frankia sp. R82]
MAWQLEADGFRVLVQAWDMVVGSDWTAAMQDGIRYSTRTIAVCFGAYLESVVGEQEWQVAFASEPSGVIRRLVPLRIEPCDRPGLLGQVVSIDPWRAGRRSRGPVPGGQPRRDLPVGSGLRARRRRAVV